MFYGFSENCKHKKGTNLLIVDNEKRQYIKYELRLKNFILYSFVQNACRDIW